MIQGGYKKKFLCVNPVSGETVEYPIERQKGNLTGAYIYDDEICYINDVTENKSIVYRQTPYSCVELFTTRKNETVSRVSADKSPAVWNVPRSYHFSYFDGVVCYETPHYSQLVRYDRQGAAYELLAGDGHGETEKILVTDKWLYVNYDAYDMLRLPKAFSAFKGYASENPEAFFLFGQHQDFRM